MNEEELELALQSNTKQWWAMPNELKALAEKRKAEMESCSMSGKWVGLGCIEDFWDSQIYRLHPSTEGGTKPSCDSNKVH